MSWEFVIGKVADLLLVTPVFHWLILSLLAVACYRHPRKVFSLSFALFIYMAVVLLSPIPRYMLAALEMQYPAITTIDPQVDTIVVLGGGVIHYHKTTQQYFTSEHAGRIYEAIRLAKKIPNAHVIISGATVTDPGPDHLSEANTMKQLALELGLNDSQVEIEENSLTTAENAKESAGRLKAQGKNKFYLVTSAFHMPRSLAAFKKFGFDPIPYPVAFQVAHTRPTLWRWTGAGIDQWSLAVHEYLGFLFYKIRGFL